MKFTFQGHHYQYAAEQMLFTLFPGEKAIYEGEDENTICLSLSRGAQQVTASAVLRWSGCRYFGSSRAGIQALTGDKRADDRVLQRLLKTAFYRAGVQVLGQEPPWGMITGVRPAKIPTKALLQGETAAQAERALEKVYRVSHTRRRLVMDCAFESVKARQILSNDEVSLYVGIPFCPTRCTYCSFVSADVQRSLKLVEPFLDTLCEEIKRTGRVLDQLGCSVRTVYIGGGTPTTLSADQLARLMEVLSDRINLSRCTEYTVEAGRPDTITKEKLAVLSRNGADRISVNPQSMSSEVLAAMGRAHRGEDIFRAYDLARESGIPCINMDLIAGLPTDTLLGFQASLDQVRMLGPENITVHTLALKRGSSLLAQGAALPADGVVAQMLDYAWSVLEQDEFKPYYLYRQKYMSGSFENVGWTKPGFENLYNLCMMEELHPVFAVGAGGVTKLVDTQRGEIVRIANPKYPYEYLDSLKAFGEREQRIHRFFSREKDNGSKGTKGD